MSLSSLTVADGSHRYQNMADLYDNVTDIYTCLEVVNVPHKGDLVTKFWCYLQVLYWPCVLQIKFMRLVL